MALLRNAVEWLLASVFVCDRPKTWSDSLAIGVAAFRGSCYAAEKIAPYKNFPISFPLRFFLYTVSRTTHVLIKGKTRDLGKRMNDPFVTKL